MISRRILLLASKSPILSVQLVNGASAQELWAMLHSASNNATGVPDQLQKKHQEDQRKRDEHQAVVQVSSLPLQ